MESNIKAILGIISVLGVIIPVIKILFKIWNKTTFEKMLTSKYEAKWEEFLENIVISIFPVFGIVIIGYIFGEKFNISGNEWLVVSSLIAMILIMFFFLLTSLPLLIPNVKQYIRQGYKLKNTIKACLIIGYFCFIYIAVIIISFNVDNDLNNNISFYNQLPNLLFYGGTYIIIFIIVSYIIKIVYRAYDLFNVQRDIYKVTKVESGILKSLYFVYALKEDIHILNKYKDKNDFSEVFVYYLKEDLLMKYELQKENNNPQENV